MALNEIYRFFLHTVNVRSRLRMRRGQGATFEMYLAACLFQLQEGFCRRDLDLQELVPGAQLMTCLNKPKQLTFTFRFSGEAHLSLKLSC